MTALLALLALAAGAPGPAPPSLASLLAEARDRGLARDRHWIRLGHWRQGLLGGWESEVDGPGFFLSPRGKEDPQAELDATIAGLFAPEPADEKLQHPQCQFPARLAFLVRRLGLDPTALPPRRCPRLEEWWERTAARGITLVFSSYYMNNPASAFGHTFLRLDRAPRAGDRIELVDQGIDYAATVDTANPVVYAVKGLLGFFKGEFSARPYFYKVREYADFESRDLWEYELDLDPAAVALLVAHLWELGSTWFDYFYLTENCSYHVLGALEAAEPRLDLLAHVGKVTIPADTVKALHRNEGLVRRVSYRPSARTQLERRVAPLSDAERAAALAVARDPAAPLPSGLPDAGRARTLDVALDLVDVRRGREVVRGEPEALALRQAVLERRSAVPVASPPLVVEPPPAGGPERGHDSFRAAVAGGAERDRGAFALLEWRLALHDLADPPAGFSPATGLEFVRLRGRVEERGPRLRLDEAVLVEAASMTPLDALDPRISFRVRAGAARIRDAGCRGCVAGTFEAGGGGTVALGPAGLLVTGDGEVEAAPDLSGLDRRPFRLGLGPTATLRLLGGSRAALLASGSWRWLPFARPERTWKATVEGRVHFGPVSVFAEGTATPLEREVLAGVQVFY